MVETGDGEMMEGGPGLSLQGEDGIVANNNSNKTEMVRLIIQSLQHLGYGRSASFLEKDSGILLQSPSVTSFSQSVLEGRWARVDELLPSLMIKREDDIAAVKFVIYSQKFLELLESRKVKEALHCLRSELTPLNQSPDRLHRLASLVMCMDIEDLKKKAEWPGSSPSSRRAVLERVRGYVNADVMLPEHRLAELLQQSINFQTNQCLYHNTTLSHFSLFTDHTCDNTHLPSLSSHILDKHTDEVWFITFSNNGKYLASAGKDCTVLLWDTTSIVATSSPSATSSRASSSAAAATSSFQLLRVMNGHNNYVSYLSFSPDDESLLSCSEDGTLRLWSVKEGTCTRVYKHHVELGVTACAWLPDGKAFVSGGNDKNVFVVGVDGHTITRFPVARVNDLAVTSDGEKVVVVCQEKKIRILYLKEKRDPDVIQEADSVTSVALSSNNKYLLVNISSNSTETHMWDLRTLRLVQKFIGQKQGRFVIRSCFGGLGDTFVVSGSEDCNVYIWHREHGTLLSTLSGHTRTVNCVAWNPKNPHMLASASDDYSIRIWTSPSFDINNNNNNNNINNSNGVHSSSSNNNNHSRSSNSSETGKLTP